MGPDPEESGAGRRSARGGRFPGAGEVGPSKGTRSSATSCSVPPAAIRITETVATTRSRGTSAGQ